MGDRDSEDERWERYEANRDDDDEEIEVDYEEGEGEE